MSRAIEWLINSSADPTKYSLAVKGVVAIAIPYLLTFLPLIGVQLSPDFANLPDMLYGVVFYGLTIIGSISAIVGFVRKIWNTLFAKGDISLGGFRKV